jgi:TPR repeat protein
MEAQYQLGMMYGDREGVKRDYDESYFWMEKAAEQGHVMAQYRLGSIYANGLGINKSLILAYMWTDIAIEGGYKEALEKKYELATMMTFGQIETAKKMVKEWLEKH